MNRRGQVLLALGICSLLTAGVAAAYSPALEVTHEYTDHGGTLVDVEYDEQHDTVWSLDENGTFVAYQVGNEEIGLKTDQFSVGHALAVGDNTVYIAAANTLWEFDVVAGNLSELATLEEHAGAMAYDPQRDVVWTTGLGTVYGYDAENGSEVRRYSPHSDGIETIAVQGEYVATGTTWAPDLAVYDVAAEEVVLRPEFTNVGGVTATQFTEDGDLIVGTRGDGADDLIATYDVESGERLLGYRAHIFGVSHVAYEPTTETIISTGGDNAVRFYDVDRGTVFAEYGHEDTIYTADLDRRNAILWLGDGEERVGTVTGLDIDDTESAETTTAATTEDTDGSDTTATDTADAPATTAQQTTDTEGPGFGLGVAAIAALLVALIVRRRR
jgi:PGF-CTERM protein